MILYARCKIAKDMPSGPGAFLGAEELIAYLISPSVIFGQLILSSGINSSFDRISGGGGYMASKNASHFALNSVFNSFCEFRIENIFSIKRDLMNLYI